MIHQQDPLQFLSSSASINDEISAANKRWHEQVKIDRSNGSFGVHALRSFEVGSIVLSGLFLGDPHSHRHSHTIQTGPSQHRLMDLPARLLNHSCNANLGARKVSNAYDFIARRNIQAGEELTFDYETTEDELGHQFRCSCGSLHCRKDIKGFHYHAAAVRRQVDSEWIAEHLLEYSEER